MGKTPPYVLVVASVFLLAFLPEGQIVANVVESETPSSPEQIDNFNDIIGYLS